MDESVSLTSAERDELRARTRSRSLRAEDVRRARLILLLDDGRSYTEIQRCFPVVQLTSAVGKRDFWKPALPVCFRVIQGERSRSGLLNWRLAFWHGRVDNLRTVPRIGAFVSWRPILAFPV